jgi:hypothetical protein
MSFASKVRIPVLTAAALITAASITSGAAAQAAFEGYGFGTGTSATEAKFAAQRDLIGNFSGCSLPPNVVYDRGSGTTWSAEVSSICQGYR